MLCRNCGREILGDEDHGYHHHIDFEECQATPFADGEVQHWWAECTEGRLDGEIHLIQVKRIGNMIVRRMYGDIGYWSLDDFELVQKIEEYKEEES